LYWSQGKHQLAIQSLTRALELYPEYRWGWNELHAWNHSLDKQSDTASLIKSTREKHPNSATLALVEATTCGVTTDALDVLKQFLEGHPNSLEVFTEYCYLYCDLQKSDTAKETLETSRWKDSSITEISTLRAYIEVERGYIDRGIDIMNAVVAVQPGLSSGWRYLIIWHSDHKRDTKAVKQCLDHFIKLNNTNAKELYFAAGKLNNTSPEDPLVANLVERCIRLDPFNPGYLELYVDQLLKTEGKSEKNSQTISHNHLQNNQSLINKLETVLEITAPIKDSVVHLIASLQTACIKKEEPEKLAAIWSDILSKKDILYYQLEKAWNCLDQNGRVLTATNTLEEKWKNGEEIAPIAGEFLTTGKAKNLTIKKLDQWILTMDWSGEFSDYILEGYLRHSISLEAPINKKVLLKYTQKIYDNTTNWGLVGYSYATQADWRHATDWLESYSSKNNVQAWHIYFYAIAKLQRGNWEYGIKAMHDAYQLPADAYRDEIVTWVTLDNLLNQQPVNLDEFNNLVIKELSSYGSYAHHLAQVLAKLENSTFEAESKHINPILRQCQRIYQNVVGQPSVNMARQKAKKHIKNKIASKHVVKILWQWRLSNLF
jgi:tetratricopeptide (TPR) repeat protein